MSAPGTWSRRSLLLAGAGLAAAGCTPFGTSNARRPLPTAEPGSASASSASAQASPSPASPPVATLAGVTPSVRFDLAARPRASLREIGLHEPDSSLQGIGYDTANHRLFAVQGRDGRPGADLCINQLGPHGTVLAHLHVNDAGHGQSFGVESSGSKSRLWLEWDANENTSAGRGTALARFTFVPGQRPQVEKFFTGSREVGCAIDPVTRRLLVRQYEGTGPPTYQLYDLADARKGDFGRPLAVIPEPRNSLLQPTGGTPVLQAFTAMGSYVYSWLGTGGHAGTESDPFNTYLSAIDLRTGRIVQQRRITVAPSLVFREPEGLAIDVVDGAPRLCFGFASRPDPDSPQRLASVYYLDTLL